MDKYEVQSQTKKIFPLEINAIAIEIGTLKEQISNLKNDSNKKDNLINILLTRVSCLEKDKVNLSGKITDLQGQCKELTDNQIVFFGYLNLITNGRDIEKSIVHYLLIYLNFIPK